MRILFVGFPESIHTARWIAQLADEDWDIHLFPVHDGPVHPDLKNVTVHSFYRTSPFGNNDRVTRKGLPWPVLRGRGKIKAALERTAPHLAVNSARLARAIRTLEPDVIHVMEMQHAGYLALDSFTQLGASISPCIYSSWGSDFYRYGNESNHQERIRDFLKLCDYYIADCHRDVLLARDFGFAGEVLGVLPVGGGFDLQYMGQFRQPLATRKTIALKGYHSDRLLGRALHALEALCACEDLLSDYEVIVYSADREVSEAVRRIAANGLRFRELSATSHDEMIKLMGRSRVALSIGLTDGTPNSLLEAMIMGAFPIQSATVSTAEWIDNGKNGFLVPPEDTDAIAAAIRKALSDDELLEEAARTNNTITTERIDCSIIKPQVIQMYKSVAASRHRSSGERIPAA